jgi:hypothetical protein
VSYVRIVNSNNKLLHICEQILKDSNSSLVNLEYETMEQLFQAACPTEFTTAFASDLAARLQQLQDDMDDSDVDT